MRAMTVDVKADRKAVQAAEAAKAMGEYRAQQAAIDANTERLRALRLARDAQVAAAPPVVDIKPKKKTKTKR